MVLNEAHIVMHTYQKNSSNCQTTTYTSHSRTYYCLGDWKVDDPLPSTTSNEGTPVETSSCALCSEGLVPRGWVGLPLTRFLKLLAMKCTNWVLILTFTWLDVLRVIRKEEDVEVGVLKSIKNWESRSSKGIGWVIVSKLFRMAGLPKRITKASLISFQKTLYSI